MDEEHHIRLVFIQQLLRQGRLCTIRIQAFHILKGQHKERRECLCHGVTDDQYFLITRCPLIGESVKRFVEEIVIQDHFSELFRVRFQFLLAGQYIRKAPCFAGRHIHDICVVVRFYQVKVFCPGEGNSRSLPITAKLYIFIRCNVVAVQVRQRCGNLNIQHILHTCHDLLVGPKRSHHIPVMIRLELQCIVPAGIRLERRPQIQ